MSGHWPPEWEDSEEEFSGENDQLDTEAEARLSEVAAFLATVPAPAMPDAVESRISAALATEAATRGESAAQPDGSPDRKAAAPANGARSLGPAPDRARVRRHRDGGGPRRRFRVRPQVVGGSLVTVLLVALVAFGLSRAGSSSSSSSAAAGSAAQPANAGASSAAASSAAGPKSVPSAAVPGAEHTVPTFAVSVSGTRYQEGTLAAQVQAKLAAGGQATFGSTVSGTGAGAGSAGSPSPALRGCVAHFTNGAPPRLVDRATYNGLQVYVIASAVRVWVVGLGCTAAKPELVTSVPLAG